MNRAQPTRRGVVLVIAGSDSSGVSGLEADQKVIAAHGCYAMTVTTALTVQDTRGVYDLHLTPPIFVCKQIKVCISDIAVDVMKIGMLASAETVNVVADAIKRYHVKITVVDPIMVSSNGFQLLPLSAIRELRKSLLPMTTILTPNVPEAKLLLSDAGHEVKDPQCVEDLIWMAKAVQALGPKFVLMKGGYLPLEKNGRIAKQEPERELVVDILCGDDKILRIDSMYRNSNNNYGTGCSLASAIASNLAVGLKIPQAVKAACRYVEVGIMTAVDLGHGHGPINHFHSMYTLPFAPGRFLEYLLDRPDVQKVWQAHTEHQFVTSLANGTLAIEAFKNYLIQDYLYLIQFARANALAAYKAKTIENIAASAKIVTHIQNEMSLHIDYCKGFGIAREQMEAAEESEACTAYTRYVLDIGQSEDWLALQISMAPCLIGYGVIANRLHKDPKTKREDNPYWTWIRTYVAEDYTEAVRIGTELIERNMVLQSQSRIEELVSIFIHATNMEIGFWELGFKK